MKQKQEKLTVVEQCAREMATLDAAGRGVIVIRCNNDTEIRRIIGEYAYKEKTRKSSYASNCKDAAKEYVPTTSDRLKEVTPLGMVHRIGEMFTWTKHGYMEDKNRTDYGAEASLITDLTNRVTFPKSMEHTLLYIPNAQKVLGTPDSCTEIQKQYVSLLETLARLKKQQKSNALVVVGCNDGVLHEDLKRFSYIMDVPYPDADELAMHIEHCCRACDAAYRGMPKSLLNGLAEEMRGFREDDVYEVISMAYASEEEPLSDDASALFRAARDIKKQLIAGVTGLSWLDTDQGEIGGLDTLRVWLAKKKWALNYPHVAALQKVSAPKGVLLCGLPGSGKTTLARFTAKLLGRGDTPLPLLKMNITEFKSKYVGETTEKCENALRTVESAAPAVLLIDEVEKIFGGMGTGSAHEVTGDMFSIILDWMQKKKDKPVFVIATANRSEKIPSEFKRKGRFDEVFFVGVPSAEECKDIFAVHLERKKDVISCTGTWKDAVTGIAEAVLCSAAELERFLSGADIESLVDAAFEQLFVSVMETMTAEQLRSVEEASAPISVYSEAQVKDALIRQLKHTRSYFDNNMQVTAGYWLDMYRQQFLEAGGQPDDKREEGAVQPAESNCRVILPSCKESFKEEYKMFVPAYFREQGLLSAKDSVIDVDKHTTAEEYEDWLDNQLQAARAEHDYDGVFRWCLAREIFGYIERIV